MRGKLKMKNTNFLAYAVRLLAAIAILVSASFARSPEEIRKELIVKFRVPIIKIADSIDSGGKELIKLPDHPIGATLLNSNLVSIRRAHPLKYWGDSIVYNQFGMPVKRPNLSGIYRIAFPDISSRDRYFQAIKDDSDIAFVIPNEPDELLQVFPNDPDFSSQWALHNDGSWGTEDCDIDAPEAWEIETGNSSTIIGIVDEGIKADHEDLYPKVYGDVGSSDHGTNVAGVAAANTNNGIGIAGVNWNARLLNKITDLELSTSTDKIIEAVDVGAHVINCSWGRYNFYGAMQDAVAYAYKMNRVVVAAKGEQGTNQLHYPSDYLYVVGVSGSDDNDHYRPPSDYGNGVDLCAPAEWILTTGNPTYEWCGGTSMAAPFVSGVASLLYSHNSQLCNDDITNIMAYSADDVHEFPADTGYDDYTGWGRVNAGQALEMLQPPYLLNHFTTSGGWTHQVLDNVKYFFVGVPGLADGSYIVDRHEIRKNVTFPQEFPSTPFVWGRSVATQGFSASNPNYGAGFTGIIGGSVTTSGCQLTTFVYYVWTGEGWEWFPCEPSQVQFAYTCWLEYRLLAPSAIHAVWEIEPVTKKQAMKLYWDDPNAYEDGWVIERRQHDSTVWSMADTLLQGVGTITYYDTTFVGSETYCYRVHAFKIGGYPFDYSPQSSITAPPRWPRNFTGEVVIANPAGGGGLMGTDGAGAPDEPEIPSPEWESNSIRLTWLPPLTQKLPVSYEIKQTDIWNPWWPDYYETSDTTLLICGLETETIYFFNIRTIDSQGGHSSWLLDYYDELSLLTGWIDYCPGPDPIFPKISQHPLATQLTNCYPNPFNPSTSFEFSLAEPGQVTAEVYNTLGQRIKTVHNDFMETGIHTFLWDGTDDAGSPVASGVYFLRVQSENYSASRKMLLIK
jgi:hypothetical protein